MIGQTDIVFQLLDPIIVGVELQRHGRQGRHGLDVDAAFGFVPQFKKRADAAGGEVDVVGQQGLVHGGTTREAVHGDFDVAQAGILGAGFDQFLVDDDVHGQIQQPELLGKTDFVRFRPGRGGASRRHGERDGTAYGGSRCFP